MRFVVERQSDLRGREGRERREVEARGCTDEQLVAQIVAADEISACRGRARDDLGFGAKQTCARVFDGRPAEPVYLVTGAVLWLLVCRLPAIADSVDARVLIASAALAESAELGRLAERCEVKLAVGGALAGFADFEADGAVDDAGHELWLVNNQLNHRVKLQAFAFEHCVERFGLSDCAREAIKDEPFFRVCLGNTVPDDADDDLV